MSLGWNFIDIDNELTKSFDMSINELFLKGEENFRKLEFAELQKHILKENTVIAVGGGAVSYKDSFELLKKLNFPFKDTRSNLWLS